MKAPIEYDKSTELITKCNQKDQNFLLRYFSRLPLYLKIDIEKKRKKTFHSLRQKFTAEDNDLLSYSALILTLRSMYALEKKITSKTFDDMSIEEIRNISIIKINRNYEKAYLSTSPKRERLLHYWAVVKLCRTEKTKPMSFVNISKYLKKHYHFEVGHNLVAQLWRELEIDKDMNNDR